MKLIDFAKRRPDGLIDQAWVDGFEAFKLQKPPESCPYVDASEQFNSWVEGWMDAAYSGNNFSQDQQNPVGRKTGCEEEQEDLIALSSLHSPEAPVSGTRTTVGCPSGIPSEASPRITADQCSLPPNR